jgi:hypothetical protein
MTARYVAGGQPGRRHVKLHRQADRRPNQDIRVSPVTDGFDQQEKV